MRLSLEQRRVLPAALARFTRVAAAHLPALCGRGSPRPFARRAALLTTELDTTKEATTAPPPRLRVDAAFGSAHYVIDIEHWVSIAGNVQAVSLRVAI